METAPPPPAVSMCFPKAWTAANVGTVRFLEFTEQTIGQSLCNKNPFHLTEEIIKIFPLKTGYLAGCMAQENKIFKADTANPIHN